MKLKHFTLSEFDSPDIPGSGANMNPDFMEKLDKARELAGIPFRVNSGWRSKAHNAIVKGVKDSSHYYGYAADLHCIDVKNRLLIVKALLSAGFTRIGIADGFIHVDNDPTKAKECIWLY